MTARRTGPRKRRVDARQQTNAPIVTINEAAEAFPDEWIFMQVMEFDEDGWPLNGVVLAHHPKRSGIEPTIHGVITDPPPDARGFFTYRGPRFRTTQEWRQYLEREQAARDSGS